MIVAKNNTVTGDKVMVTKKGEWYGKVLLYLCTLGELDPAGNFEWVAKMPEDDMMNSAVCVDEDVTDIYTFKPHVTKLNMETMVIFNPADLYNLSVHKDENFEA